MTERSPYLKYNQIKNYFDALDNQFYHFENTNDVCTPMDCVRQMVDTIPNDFWQRKDIKVFDSCCGNGNFHAYIYTKTQKNNLYFNELNATRIENTKKYFGPNIHLTKKDFLTFEEQEAFDLVVSNPPYAKFNGNKRVSKNHNLSRDFIKKALKVTKKGGYILFIVPNNWMSFSDRNTLPKELSQYQFLHIDIHGAKKWFPKVGSSFTWFLLRKIPNEKPFNVVNNYILKDFQRVKIPTNIDFIPLYLSDDTIKIIQKVVLSPFEKYSVETSSHLHRFTKKDCIQTKRDAHFKHKLIHTPTQTVWSNQPHKYQKGYKVFISLTNQYSTFIEECGMTQSIAFIRCKTLQEAKEIKTQLDNPVYKFINNITRYGNFNNIRVLQRFSKLQYINLTEKEFNLITSFNKKYYGKKKKK